tara:strand:- start:257 stop:490 length:234 start_codon:yes stop_codon:yes gene_type:complete
MVNERRKIIIVCAHFSHGGLNLKKISPFQFYFTFFFKLYNVGHTYKMCHHTTHHYQLSSSLPSLGISGIRDSEYYIS